MPSPIKSASSSVIRHGALDVSRCVRNRRIDPLVPRRRNHPRVLDEEALAAGSKERLIADQRDSGSGGLARQRRRERRLMARA